MGVFGRGRPGWGVIGRRVGCIGVGGGAGGGGICIRGFWIGGRGGGALSVLGGFSAQSTCKCVVRKLVVYLVH